MNQSFNQELSEKYQEVCRLDKIHTLFAKLEKERDKTKIYLQEAKGILEKETRDYEKLSEMSISKILYTISGKLEQKNAKEKEEMLQAALMYKQYQKNLDDIQKQIKDLELEKLNYCNSKENYAKLQEQKLTYLKNQNHPYTTIIMELEQKLEKSKNNQIEINEAIQIGAKIKPLIFKIEESLENAENWGAFDLLAGGLISTMIKHSHIDESEKIAEEINNLLKQFQRELIDIDITEEIIVNFSSFEKFADYFFDGIIVDWYILDKIKSSKTTVSNIKNHLDSIMKQLFELNQEESTFQKQTEEKIENLIIQG